jgi:hypothetical protein
MIPAPASGRAISFTTVLLLFAFVSSASAATKSVKRPRTTVNEPFTTFRQLDQVLTRMDRSSLDLNSEIKNAEKQIKRQRARTVRALRHSKQMRSLFISSRSLLRTTARAEKLYSRRSQRYGRRLFRDLHAKAIKINRTLVLESRATTLSNLKAEQQRFSSALLPFVLQFQAISGGFAALRCDPGGWACCQPKVVKQTATVSAAGCTWICATQVRACRYGCLGPRTPRTTSAENNIETQSPRERQR